MDLKFIGRGSAFNTLDGNTSAFYREDNKMFLIDCGESVFGDIRKHDILNGIDDINVAITHTHPDHAGSLGSLAFFSHFYKNKNINVLTDGDKRMNNVRDLLKINGVTKEQVNYLDVRELDKKFKHINTVRFIPTKHSVGMECFGIEWQTKNGVNYYSGDTNESTHIEKIIYNNEPIERIYCEATANEYAKQPQSVHLHIDALCAVVPPKLRHLVTVMHLDNDTTINRARERGFDIAKKI